MVKQLAGIVHACWCVSGPGRAHADAEGQERALRALRALRAQRALELCLPAPARVTRSRRPVALRCALTYTGLHAAPHRAHLVLPPSQTYEHLPPSLPTSLLPPSHQSLHQTFHTQPVVPQTHALPHALYPRRPSSSIIVHIPACPCPTHRPVTRPPPDSPRPRYPYDPSRASAPSVNHLLFLPIARRHCAALHRRSTLLIDHPIHRTVHQRLRVHSNSNQPSRHHSTLQQTIHGTPPMRALKPPNLWRIL